MVELILAAALVTLAPGEANTGEPLDAPAAFVRANTAYEEGRYGTAISLYQALVNAGHDSGAVLFNLGNSYLRTGALGPAVAAYRRSQALLPRNNDVRANLAFARKSAKDAVVPTQQSQILRTLLFWHFSMSHTELTLGFLGLNAALWVLLGLRLFLRDSELLRWALGLSLVLTLALGGSVLVRHTNPQTVAIMQNNEVDVHSGRDTESVIRFKLHEGTEADVVSITNGWVRIELGDGKQGWVRQTELEIVTL